MEKLMSVQDIRDRYNCNDRTARKYMREMGALDIRPMMVSESAVVAWEARKRMATPAETAEAEARKRMSKKQMLSLFPIEPVQPKPGQRISRVRPKSLRQA